VSIADADSRLFGLKDKLRSSAPKLATWYTGSFDTMNHVIMDILASNAFGGIVGIVTGVLMIVFHECFARKSVREQNASSLFSRSGLMREKWNREDYRRRTISRAILRAEFYTPAKDGAAQPSRNGHNRGAETPVVAARPRQPKFPEAKAFPVDAMPAPCRPLIEEATASFGCAPELVALPILATRSRSRRSDGAARRQHLFTTRTSSSTTITYEKEGADGKASLCSRSP
jgi:hypothetical protein